MADYKIAKKLRKGIEDKIHALEPSPVLSNELFPWAKKLEEHYSFIRNEAEVVLNKIDSIVNFNEIVPNQRALTQDQDWKSFFLKVTGEDVLEHQFLCPVTSQLINEIPGLINAFFSILKPGTHIPPHRGPYAGALRYHLGVIIPEGDVGIRIEDKTYRWEEGKSFFFDDSFNHEAWNKTDSTRLILFVDFKRPLTGLLNIQNKIILKSFEYSPAVKIARKKTFDSQISSI